MMRLRLFGLAAFIAALSLCAPVNLGAFLSGQWPQSVPPPDEVVRALLPRLSEAGRAVKLRLVQGLGTGPAPVTIGNLAAGTFGDATGHSGQSHLVYAENSRVWWLFTLTSDADSNGGTNHVVKAYVSSGPDLTRATWTGSTPQNPLDSPAAPAGQPNQALRGGRSLAVAYLDNSPLDVIHAEISMAFDGQNGRTGHIRAIVTGTTITWSPWNFFDEPAATWTQPHGNVIGVSSGNFIHTGGPILQQEVDANARKSNNADTGSNWTNSFGKVSVIDNSMTNQSNSMMFAPLTNNVMLAVYDNGKGNEPNLTNLRYKKSNADGTWPTVVIGSQAGGDGDVFGTTATIDQNDWSLAAPGLDQIYAFRRSAGGGGVDAASYSVAGNSWSPMSPAPPGLGSKQAVKAGAGVFAATDGTNVYVCVVNTDSANSILCSRFDGTVWFPWTAVPGTDIGIQNRHSLSGSPQVGNGLVGLIWTEGASFFDIVTTSFLGAPDLTAPTVTMTAPLDKANIGGVTTVTATASDNVGVAGVQFKLDGVALGAEVTAAPYTILWNTETALNGAHTLSAVARDDAGNTATASTVSVTVFNAQTPIITWPPPQRLVLGTALSAAQLNATANTPGTFVYTPPAGTVLPAGLGQTLSTVFTPNDSVAFKSATASVTIDVVMVVPNVVGMTRTAATTAITGAGLTVGTVTQASSLTVPAGSVISQTPVANTETATAIGVDLVVSTGAVTVPSVVGLTQAAATTALTAAGLTVGTITTASSTTVPSGSVISQTPTAGTSVLSNSAVTLVVSSGPPQVAVPNVVGLTQTAATTAITGANLVVGTVTTQSSTTVPSGSVISQNPTAGTQVVVGSAVNLVVSSGPPQVAVPNVVGLTQAAATTAITNVNLVLGTVTTQSSTTVPSGSVISQNPTSGTQVVVGSAVNLVVSSGPAQVAVPNVVGLTQAAATTAITSAGLTVGTVTTASSTTVAAGSVISQNPTGGTQVATNSAVALVVSSGPPQVAVPNVVGLTQGAASTAITNAALTVGGITNAPSSTVPVGAVISQNPAAATQVVVGSAVALVVSSGPPPVTVPNVVGLTQGAASTAITNAGLLVGAVTTATSATVPAGSVISQNPAAGAVVASGSAIALLVSSGPAGAPAALSIDKTVSADGVGTVTTPAFSTSGADELLVLFATSAGIQSQSSKQTLSISGAGLTWTLANRSNTQFGTAEIWTANAASPVTNGTVTSVQSVTSSFHQSLTLIAFKGAGGTGAIAATSSAFGPTTVSLTTTAAGSFVYATSNDSARAAARTVPADQVMVHQWVDTAGGSTYWVQALAAPVANIGTPVTINDTVPTSDRWNAAAIEILVGTAAVSPTVPSVVGLTQAAAADAITGAGLVVGTVTTSPSTTVPAGSVVSQNPIAGSQVASGSAVALVVSSGPAQVAVPNVVGLTQAAATTAITNANLVLGTVTTQSSTTVPSGSVISQNPTSGTQVVVGSAVNLVVSSGPPRVAVPNVVGLTQAAATTAITNANLIVGTVTTQSSTTVPSGAVISQNPAAAKQVVVGSAVALVV